jgi:hypothetical protein
MSDLELLRERSDRESPGIGRVLRSLRERRERRNQREIQTLRNLTRDRDGLRES